MTKTMKVEGPLHVICQCDKCKPQISFNAEVIGYVEPQRTWVGLTEQEHTDIAVECGCMSADWVFYGAAVERKLKEKNT